MASVRQRSWFGWGFADDALDDVEVAALGSTVATALGGLPHVAAPPSLDEVELPRPRTSAPTSLAHLVEDTVAARAAHTYGKAFRDVARAYERRWENPPDLVAYPQAEGEVVDLLDWAVTNAVAVVPFGGGSSVVGGVEGDLRDTHDPDRPVVCLDVTGLAGVVEVDEVSRAALVRAGTYGPDADVALKPYGLSLRFYPQSYEHSTVGGWIATRAGGHFATGPTHVDDLTESVRAVTPTGVWESRRLPASGSGPSPDRLLLGSEGTMGVITQAWLRLHPRPTHRASASVRLPDIESASTATRLVAQSGLAPSNCRLLDPVEAQSAGVTDGWWVLLLAFESADHPVDDALARAVQICSDWGGQVHQSRRSDPARGWRQAFLRAPYLRDAMVRLGYVAETFETACTWRDLPGLHRQVTEAVTGALQEVCGGGQVGMRITHVYPDGVAPYYTVLAPGRHGSLVSMWDDVKVAASEAIVGAGGSITHHHAVGRAHAPWYRAQRPEPFSRALAAARRELDPQGVLNPGVLD